ncbi:MAG: substrate-binding domain-containing protein [Collinsella sp.]
MRPASAYRRRPPHRLRRFRVRAIPTPQISTIRRFPERLAHEGCQALLALLRGEEPEMETLVPVKLVPRASS